MTSTILLFPVLLALLLPSLSLVAAQVVNGDWSPWQIDPDIDCCSFGGYERVRRFCNNPTPDNGGTACLNQAAVLTTTEEVWRTCTCSCYPQCDGSTSFCANDTGGPARCFCIYGKVRETNYDPNSLVTCVEPTEMVVSLDTAKTCNALSTQTQVDVMSIVRYVSGAWIILWCIAIIIVMLAFKVSYPARFLHLMEELTLIVTVLLLIVPFEDMIANDEIPCKIVSFLAQYIFQVLMVFLFLEALHAYSLVSFITPSGGMIKMIINFLLAFLVPLLMCIVSLVIVYNKYGTSGCHCLCDFSSGQAWGYLTPVGMWAFCVAIAGEAAAGEKYKQLIDTDPDQYIHATVCRRGVLFVAAFAVMAYVFGLLAVDTQNAGLYVAFAVFSFFLGPTIFIYHTAPDKHVATAFNKKAKWAPWYKAYLFKPGPKGDSGVPLTGRKDSGGVFKDFYKWVTDGTQGDVAKESEDVLFNKQPT